MTTHIEPAAMDIDSDHSSSATSDTSYISFKDDFDTLPASGASTQAHIIDFGEYEGQAKQDGAIKLQDAIVTTLFSISPDTLRSFLSPLVNNFKAVFGKKDVQLVVWRKGLEVFVSGRTFLMCQFLTVMRRLAHSNTTRA